MTSFISLRLLGHGAIFCAQSGEYLLCRRHTTSVGVGNPASERRIKGGQPSLAFVKKAETLAQYLTL